MSYGFRSLVVLLLLSMLVGCGAGREADISTPVTEPTVPPPSLRVAAVSFSLAALDGRTVSLEDFRGKVVLLNFWASWCPSCRAEMASLDLYYQTHRDEGLVVLAVNYREDAETVLDFLKGEDVTFSILLDEEGRLATDYGVVGLPTSYFIDCEGRVIGFWPGGVTASWLEEQLTPYLGECADLQR